MKELPNCEYMHIHQKTIDKVNAVMPKDETLYDLALLYSVFADSTRIRILYALYCGEMCVCDLAKILNMTVSSISHQLKTLKINKLVKHRKEGKTVFYSLDDDHVKRILKLGMEHIEEK